MATRIITAAVAAPILILLLLFGNIHVLTVIVALAALIGLNEFYKATGERKNFPLCLIGYIGATFICLSVFIQPVYVMLCGYLVMLALFIMMLVQHDKIGIADVAIIVVSLIYIPYFFTNLLYIRNMELGKFYIWLPIIGAFATDTFAYFVGVFFGKHKLCPVISPKKTIEGAIGGVVGSALIFMFFGFIMSYFFSINVSFVKLGILGLIVSPLSEVGDLVASIIKRHYGIKDYGSLLPGHGGILDRCDSLIMVAPLIYIFLLNIGILA